MRIATFFLFTCFVLLNGFRVLHGQNVGIGTTAPSDKLTVETDNNSYGITHRSIQGNILSTRIGGTTAGIGTFSATDMRIFSGGLSRIYINQASGEVAIGTDAITLGNKLFVRTASGSYGITHSDGSIVLSSYLGGNQPYAYIGTQSNHALAFFTNQSEAQAILLPNGNFGIGTTSPGTKLEVGGSVRVQNNGEFFGTIGIGTFANAGTGLTILKDNEAIRINGNQSFMTFYNGASYKGYLWNKGADDMEFGTAGVNANGKLFLSIKGTPRLSISNTGQVSVNGAASPYLSPDLTVNGTLSLYVSGQSEWALRPSYCPGEGGPCLFLYGVGVERSKVDADGDWIPLSDRSLKENIQEYKPVLEGIKKIQVSTYHFKYNSPGKKSFGLIAQNVAEYFPEIVSSFACDNGKNLLGISYGKTGVLAIKAIQEQQEIIEQQQTKIESLEKRLAALEKLLLKN